MSSGKKVASVAFTGVAATAATMMGAGPALAAVSWHVKDGGVGYTGPVTAKNKTGTSPSLKDTSTGAILKCKKAVASGVVSKSHSPANPAQLGYLKKSVTKWSSCTAVDFEFKARLTRSLAVVASTYSTNFGGETTGKLLGSRFNTIGGKISGKISGINGNDCHATISGKSVPMKYLNSRHSFFVNSARTVTLKVKSATGTCFGRLNTGDNAYFHGIYHVSFPTDLTISRF